MLSSCGVDPAEGPLSRIPITKNPTIGDKIIVEHKGKWWTNENPLEEGKQDEKPKRRWFDDRKNETKTDDRKL